MKQTIKEFTIKTEIDDVIIEVSHLKTYCDIVIKDKDQLLGSLEINNELIDSLIEMLQKRKELMG